MGEPPDDIPVIEGEKKTLSKEISPSLTRYYEHDDVANFYKREMPKKAGRQLSGATSNLRAWLP